MDCDQRQDYLESDHRQKAWLDPYPNYKLFKVYDAQEEPIQEQGWAFTHRLPSMYHHLFHPQKLTLPPIVDENHQ